MNSQQSLIFCAFFILAGHVISQYCPKLPPGTIGTCIYACGEGCGPGKLCCSNGCGQICKDACPAFNCSLNCFGNYALDDKNCLKCECDRTAPCNKICIKGHKCQSIPEQSRTQCVPQTCPAIQDCSCQYNKVWYTKPNKCVACVCFDPCLLANCKGNAQCVRVFNEKSAKYVAKCIPECDNGNVCACGSPHPDVKNCGRGGTRCPVNYSCQIAANDAYALCCFDNPCMRAKCSAGYRCVAQDVQCIRAPCPPVAACVPECPMYKCAARTCTYGYSYDKNGCRGCSCLEPCKNVQCSKGKKCEVRQYTKCAEDHPTFVGVCV